MRSSILFNYIIDWILEKSLAGFAGVRVNDDCSITILDYADNVAILGESYTEFQHVLDEVSHMAKMVGMRMLLRQKFSLVTSPYLTEWL